MIDLTKIKAAFFDWDGTLVDTCGLVLNAHNHVRKFYGRPLWSMDDFLGRASKSAREYYPEEYGEDAEAAQTLLYEYIAKYHLQYLKKMDGFEEGLSLLTAQNIPIAIVSNKRHDYLEKEIDYLRARDHCAAIVGAGQAAMDKPNPAPIFMAMTAIGLSKPDLSQCIYIGDTETDLMAAQRARIPGVLLQVDKPRPDLIAKYKPAYALNSLREFFALLNS